MLQLTQGTASENIIVTLTEKVTLTSPYYLFVFTHVSEKTVVTKIINSTADLSGYTDRYNKFSINTSVLFLNKPVGQYNYQVYEQSSSTNTDPDLATTLLESGKLLLKPATEFSHVTYDEQQTFKEYQG